MAEAVAANSRGSEKSPEGARLPRFARWLVIAVTLAALATVITQVFLFSALGHPG